MAVIMIAVLIIVLTMKRALNKVTDVLERDRYDRGLAEQAMAPTAVDGQLPSQPGPAGKAARARKPKRRRLFPWLAAAVVVIAACVFFAGHAHAATTTASPAPHTNDAGLIILIACAVACLAWLIANARKKVRR
jgi:hypothetical protein